MKKMKKTIYISALSLLLVTLLPSCVDNNETPPPVREFKYGEIVGVDQIKALYADQLAITDYTQRTPVEITENWALRGIITASDKTDGNLYKEVWPESQASDGAIRILQRAKLIDENGKAVPYTPAEAAAGAAA